MTELIDLADPPTAPDEPAPGTGTGPGASGAGAVLRRLIRQPGTAVALGFVILLTVVAIAAPLIAPFEADEPDYTAALSGPSSGHLLGADDFGRDTLSRLIYGSRIALMVAFGSVAVALAIGVPFGLLLGYRGGWWDRLGSRLIDVADSLPGMLVGFAVIAILGRGLGNIVLAVGVIFCMNFARITRAVALTEREKPYVDAARVAGLRAPEIVFRQVLPNLVGPLAAQAAVFMGAAIMVETSLSFLGIGLSTNDASWGSMLTVAAQELSRQPFLAFPPGLTIVASVLAFNFLAIGVGDALTGTGRPPPKRRTARREVPATPVTIEAPFPDDASTEPDGVLNIRGLTIEIDRRGEDPVPLVEDVWLSVGQGEVVGLLGESGSGKTMLARASLGLLPPSIRLRSGSVLLEGREISGRSERELREVRGPGMAAVFQNPTAAFSPVHTVGQQLCEPLRAHFGMKRAAARQRAAELLHRVGIEDPKHRLNDYPHQFSGGMAQRAAIAMALAAEPRVLIADEATSALDVTTQSHVLDLLLELRDALDMAILLITHDLGVVAETCDRAAVMYAGQIVEVNDVESLFDQPQHPYTAALLAANPSIDGEVGHMPTIAGRVPLAGEWPAGCHFASRCAFSRDGCTEHSIPLAHGVRCVRANELILEVSPR